MGKKASLPFWLSFGMKVHQTSHTNRKIKVSKLCAGILFEGFGLVLAPTSHLPQVHNRCVQSAGRQHCDRFSIAGLQEIEAIGPMTMKRPAGKIGEKQSGKPKLDRQRVAGLAVWDG